MSASIVRLNVFWDEFQLFCPVTGAQLFSAESAPDPYEPMPSSLVAMMDVIGDWYVKDADDVVDTRAIRAVVAGEDECDEGRIEKLAAALPDTCLVLELTEDARGGGHQESTYVLALNLSAGPQAAAKLSAVET